MIKLYTCDLCGEDLLPEDAVAGPREDQKDCHYTCVSQYASESGVGMRGETREELMFGEGR